MSDIKTLHMTLKTDKSGPFEGFDVLRVWDGKDISKYLYEDTLIDVQAEHEFLEFIKKYLKS